MTFDEVWAQLVRKRPGLDNPESNVEFKPEMLRRLLEQVYDQGKQSVGARGSVESIFGNLGSGSPFGNL